MVDGLERELGDRVQVLRLNVLSPVGRAAANAYAYRKRREAGYFDSSLSTVPSQDVRLGTMIYAGQTYKSRSSIDQFASYEQMATAAPVGSSMGEIMRLLGVNKPAVA